MEYMMKKRVWFEVELQGAQGDREAEFFQVSNDDTAVAQRRLEDKQPEEKTNTDCLVKEQEKEYQTWWKIKTGNVLDSCNQRSTQQCTKSRVAKHLGVAGLQQQNGLVKETNVTLLAKVVLYKNMGFNESGEYKKTFIGSGVGTGLMQVLQGDEFEVEPQDGHTFEGATLCMGTIQHREDSNETAFAVAAVEKIYVHESLTFSNTVACEVISKWKDRLKDDMDARSDAIHNEKLVQTLLKGHSILSLEGSLSGDCDVEKNDVDQSQAAYMTLTEAWKKEIWLKGLLAELGYELSLVAGIATGALVKGGSRSEVPAQVEGAAYRY
ncbi:hypothetical protein Tco_0841600 [Tanacetum coccineum]|uniref:Zinc finger, CCHC-type n=1 Tax=Tanacetum coccineum TaxID=301880 RepID=A0ABQ5B098_9ASTR